MLIITVHNTGEHDGQFYKYDARVYINREPIAHGENIVHHRATGWRNLLEKVAKECIDLEK